MHGSTCNPNPPRTEGKTEIKPERTRKLSFTPFYRNRCKSFRRSVPLSPLMIQENMKDKETYLFKKSQGFRTIRFHLTAEAIEWLDGTTKDDDDNIISNRILFKSLLSRMRLVPGRDNSFRRPQELQPGQLQFSETRLAEEWHMGRKKVRNLLATMERLGLITVSTSKVASVASVTCIEGWTDRQGSYVSNPCQPSQMALERPLNGF